MAAKSKKIGCGACLDIKIKRLTPNTIKTDKLLQLQPPLSAIIRINLKHDHETSNLGFLRPTIEVEEKFSQYFNDGLSPIQAIRLHESKILLMKNPQMKLTNAAFNPSHTWVYRQYNLWRKEKLSDNIKILDKIKEKQSDFFKKGTEVHVIEEDNQWAVLLVTPVMNRFQNYDTAKEVVLIDSSSNCDSTSVTVTVLFAVTKAGAIPVGVIIHKNESEDSYVLAFSALQSKYSKFFGGKDTPKIFITDDSVAKKNALRTCWPGSNQFLCQYHVAQAEWRWLQSRKCGISIERKRSLMTMFQKIMYANTDEKLHEAMSELNECPEKNYVSHVKSFLNHQEEWITFFRIDKLINDYNMINYSAATVKVIMNVLLGRVRAFNVIALMHYCSAVFEEYISQKIYLSVMSDKAEEEKMYNNLVEQMSDDILPQVKKIDEYSYSVPSVTDRNVSYTVDIQVGTCNCPNSRSGRFCKHQALIHKHFGGLLPKSPVMSTNDRYVLAQLALGTQCPDRNSFLDIMWTGDLTNLQETEDSSVSTVNEKVRKLDDEIEEKERNFKENILNLCHLAVQDANYLKCLKSINSALSKITTSKEAVDALEVINACLKGKSQRKVV